MKLQIHTFIGIGQEPTEAALAASMRANAFLGTHQWLDAKGQTIYTLGPPGMYVRGDFFVYAVTLIGPAEEVPAREKKRY